MSCWHFELTPALLAAMECLTRGIFTAAIGDVLEWPSKSPIGVHANLAD